MSRKKDKWVKLLYEDIVAAHKKGLNDRKFFLPSRKDTNTKEKSMALSWKPEDHPNWSAVDQESQFQDIFYQKALDRLNERAAAIFTGVRATASAQAWQIRSMDYGGPGYAGSLGKELLIKLSEGLKGAETMQLYHTYIVDLKNHVVNQYGPIMAKSPSVARDQALMWLVATANTGGDIEIFDGNIEHYHIAVVEIASGIPDKITNE